MVLENIINLKNTENPNGEIEAVFSRAKPILRLEPIGEEDILDHFTDSGNKEEDENNNEEEE